MVKVPIVSMLRKQKLNTKTIIEADLVGAYDVSSKIIWAKLFMEAQGYKLEKNILYQYDKIITLVKIVQLKVQDILT